ncbi:Bromodomain-containing factor 1 [Tolypocladium ophioglossoides CBS 100239]|uniref:Bromodomain-containing factor 1 n=1 Tax=Tolypocladium ophioglossoides (strain CBS 100239) TaxID=1163406 RepID=A0A0L0NF53_TOLOC|nr:Bromodomain-containing factor 1 [Tolypocladium ophioglossoides CBS 100239]
MASPGPDASVLDPRPQEPVLEKEAQSGLNGHASSDEPTVKSQPEPTVESQTEPAAIEEKPPPPPPPTESPKLEAEKPLVNGDGTPSDHDAPNDVATDTAESKNAVLETMPAEPKSPVPKAIEEPQPGEETVATVAEVREPELKESKVKEEPAKAAEESTPAQSPEDVQMMDSIPEPEPAELARENADEKPPAKPTDPVEESAPDMEMTDTPVDEPVTATKLADTDDTIPLPENTAAPPTSEVDLGPASMSQLAIETQEKESSPAGASVEVSMMDAPSAKVARDREDDTAEEPAPKRARTEPKEDEAAKPAPSDTPAGPVHDDATIELAAEVTVATDPELPGLDATAVTSLSQWNDSETNAKTISPYQRREIRKIDKPMDLAELDRNVRDPSSRIVTLGDFKTHLALIFENALSFNGPAHDVTAGAANAVRTIWEEVMPIPAEEPTRPKAVPKAKPVRESRAVANAEAVARRQSAGPTASPSTEAPAHPVAVIAAQEPAGDRRGSTATDGDRPKRTVRAPKPKDIDYTTKPSRKKLKPELQFCDEVLTEVTHPKHDDINSWFMEPVDAEGLNIPTYYAVIKKPMDFGRVQRMLASGEISSLKDFDKTVRLIFDNCYKFNGPPEQGNPIALIAKQLDDLYVAQMKNKDAWLAKHAAKASAPAASASNASDEEDEEEDDDAADAVPDNREIEELQVKLEEETTKLNGMFLGGNQSLIEIQKGIVDMVQNALIKAAQNAQQSRPKNDKPSKKSGKGGGKSKAAGGAGGRKSTGGAGQPKKSGGSKKAAPKKNLNAAEKDQIASAINDLEYPHLDRAIEIIKKDTGQNENPDGELELDIDQLSNDALIKLWDLCKKALPGFGKDSAAAPNSSPEVNRGATAKQAPKTAAKPKKNKPMSAQEQEARIAQLTALRNLYKPGQEPAEAQKVTQALTPMADSSDDSDSEEE